MKTKVGLLDYGCGNLHSVARACSKFADKVEIIERYVSDTSCTHLVLPGVGSYSNTIQEMRTRGLEPLIIEKINDGIPVLGICVGMQILTTIGYENGVSQGLGVINGSTEVLSLGKSDGFPTTRNPSICIPLITFWLLMSSLATKRFVVIEI